MGNNLFIFGRDGLCAVLFFSLLPCEGVGSEFERTENDFQSSDSGINRTARRPSVPYEIINRLTRIVGISENRKITVFLLPPFPVDGYDRGN